MIVNQRIEPTHWMVVDEPATDTLFDKLCLAVVVADEVLDRTRFASMDQNPKGVRDLVGSAALAVKRLQG